MRNKRIFLSFIIFIAGIVMFNFYKSSETAATVKALFFRLSACGLSGPSVVSQSAAPPFWRQTAHRSFRFCKAAPGDRGTGCG